MTVYPLFLQHIFGTLQVDYISQFWRGKRTLLGFPPKNAKQLGQAYRQVITTNVLLRLTPGFQVPNLRGGVTPQNTLSRTAAFSTISNTHPRIILPTQLIFLLFFQPKSEGVRLHLMSTYVQYRNTPNSLTTALSRFCFDNCGLVKVANDVIILSKEGHNISTQCNVS